jgi:hypothetical protein
MKNIVDNQELKIQKNMIEEEMEEDKKEINE